MLRDYSYYKTLLAGRQYPLALVDLDALQHNIQQSLQRAGTHQIRLASKSIRCRQILADILQQDSRFSGIMAYHAAEAVFLAQSGFDNILLGYPVVDPELIRAIGKQLAREKYICLMVDSIEHLQLIAAVAQKIQIPFPVCLDLDLSQKFGSIYFGVWRSPLRRPKDLTPILQQLKDNKWLRLDGLMGYEAPIAGLNDFNPYAPWKSRAIRFLKKRTLPIIQERRAAVLQQIADAGFELKFVNGGGTGSVESTIQEPGVTEVTIGSGFFAAHWFDHYRAFQPQPALFFALQVVRQPGAAIYTCHCGGYIASGPAGPDKQPEVYLPQGAQLLKNEGAGEVQTPVRYKGEISLTTGDPVLLRHAKSGEICERFMELLLVSDGKIIDRVLTYRGEGQCFG